LDKCFSIIAIDAFYLRRSAASLNLFSPGILYDPYPNEDTDPISSIDTPVLLEKVDKFVSIEKTEFSSPNLLFGVL
jgi:hypothetical protein